MKKESIVMGQYDLTKLSIEDRMQAISVVSSLEILAEKGKFTRKGLAVGCTLFLTRLPTEELSNVDE